MTAQYALYMDALKFSGLHDYAHGYFSQIFYRLLFWWYRPKERLLVSIGPQYILFLCQHSFARNFRLQFCVGVANLQF